ncbi:MAG: altronate dehydratase family protein [Pirellulaceae bacterium]|nr:altronate dehydratase family protein [Pirellulaceae bacterium]
MTSQPSIDVVYLHRDDNICLAARPLDRGDRIVAGDRAVTLRSPVKLGHKIAVQPIPQGARVVKYGQAIGVTTQDVEPGDWVHCHNLSNGDLELDYAPATQVPPAPPPITDRTFLGYRRANGKAGTRNYIAVISTVNCSASVCRFVAERFDRSLLKDYPHVDGVIALKHTSGCGMAYRGLAHEMLNRVLAGTAKHPNIGAYLLIGLGCEQGEMDYLLNSQRLVQIDGIPGPAGQPPVFSLQDLGGTVKTVEAAVRRVAELLPQANDVRRVPIPASELILGLECGGSDGNSGVTANPAVGAAADLVVACGGTAILSETPEICGAEHLLTRRSVSREVADKLIERVQWWRWYTGLFGVEVNNNPSVGNKEGGLTTIAEKSLGAVAKGGTTALVDVYQYAQPVTAKGFVFMDSPGYDPASTTGMVAGGANVVLFTTGRGSCFGCKPTPSLKIATNTPMYQRMIDDMDINAGEILRGRSVADVGREIFEQVLAVASGEKTKSELHGLGDEEFVPWTVGPVL